jgi:hypothetical protein
VTGDQGVVDRGAAARVGVPRNDAKPTPYACDLGLRSPARSLPHPCPISLRTILAPSAAAFSSIRATMRESGFIPQSVVK